VEWETVRNGNNGTKLQGVENARHGYSGKAEYGKLLIVKYMQTRTNNAVESFHAALRRHVKVAHPDIYSLVHVPGISIACYNRFRGYGEKKTTV